jgi:LacI family transcriptional regulator
MTLHGPAVREAVNGLAEGGIPTVTLISDISNTRRIATSASTTARQAGLRATSSLGLLAHGRPKSR